MTKIISILLVTIVLLLSACGGESSKKGPSSLKSISDAEATEPAASPTGIGEIKSVTLTDPLDESMVASGKAIYDMKCSACHKLTDQRVVGPGWSGVTNRRRPEWVMNMITNVDVMLEKDPEAQKMLEECLVRMPNQSVTTDDSRGILEFMRKNDMEQTGKKDGAVQ